MSEISGKKWVVVNLLWRHCNPAHDQGQLVLLAGLLNEWKVGPGEFSVTSPQQEEINYQCRIPGGVSQVSYCSAFIFTDVDEHKIHGRMREYGW